MNNPQTVNQAQLIKTAAAHAPSTSSLHVNAYCFAESALSQTSLALGSRTRSAVAWLAWKAACHHPNSSVVSEKAKQRELFSQQRTTPTPAPPDHPIHYSIMNKRYGAALLKLTNTKPLTKAYSPLPWDNAHQ